MRKILDWIADKLGYRQKWNSKPWPIFLYPRGLEELKADDIVWSKLWRNLGKQDEGNT